MIQSPPKPDENLPPPAQAPAGILRRLPAQPIEHACRHSRRTSCSEASVHQGDHAVIGGQREHEVPIELLPDELARPPGGITVCGGPAAPEQELEFGPRALERRRASALY